MPFGKQNRMEELIGRRSELNWSTIAREALKRRLRGGKRILKSLIKTKGLTVRETLELSRKVKSAVSGKKR